MNKFLIATAALVSMATAATAADMAPRPYAKAAPMMAAPAAYYDWSGVYIGANGGYGSSRNCWNYSASSIPLANANAFAVTAAAAPFSSSYNEGCHNATGGVAGGQVGYRWQTGAWVFGVEAQYNWADLSGSNASIYNTGYTNRSQINSFGLFTGQVGYAFNNSLLYVKGGAAVVDDRYSQYVTSTNLPYAQGSGSRWGSTVGVGLEYGFAPSWSLGFEYDHLFLGTKSTDFNYSPAYIAGGGYSFTDRIRQDADVFTVRLNYHWGMSSPVVARY